MFRTLRTVEPQTAAEQSAYDMWLSQRQDRETARNDRVHGAVGVIPAPLWLVLFFTAGLIVLYMLFFADSGERAVVQALLMGTVVAVLTSMLLLLNLLNDPFHDGVGGLQPVAMERSLQVIHQELDRSGFDDAAAVRRPRQRPRVGAHGRLVELAARMAPGPRLARAGAAGRSRRPRGGPRAGAGAGARPRAIRSRRR